jgi:hypothetical protein
MKKLIRTTKNETCLIHKAKRQDTWKERKKRSIKKEKEHNGRDVIVGGMTLVYNELYIFHCVDLKILTISSLIFLARIEKMLDNCMKKLDYHSLKYLSILHCQCVKHAIAKDCIEKHAMAISKVRL